MKYSFPLKILFYSVLVSVDLFLLNSSIELIREPNTYLNVAAVFIIIQTVILNLLLIPFFNKKIKSLSDYENN